MFYLQEFIQKYFKILDICIILLYNKFELLTKRRVILVTTVKVGENESLDSAMKRFKRKCQKDGIIGELRKREAYEKPSVKRKKKSEMARKRNRKR